MRNKICRPIRHSLLLEILVQQILQNHEYNIKKKNSQTVGAIEGKSCIPCMRCKCNIEEFYSQTMNSIMENFLAINKGFWNHSYYNFACYRQGNVCKLCVKCECNIEEWCSQTMNSIMKKFFSIDTDKCSIGSSETIHIAMLQFQTRKGAL